MFKTFLALMLIALQALCALPGRLHLCFESDGSICCATGSEHDCQCDHACDVEADCHDCDHGMVANESCDEAARALDAEDTHQHVVISATEMKSAPPKVADDEVQDDGLMTPLPALQVEFYCLSAPLSSQRSSTVLRC
jgi:hypothetical protein